MPVMSLSRAANSRAASSRSRVHDRVARGGARDDLRQPFEDLSDVGPDAERLSEEQRSAFRVNGDNGLEVHELSEHPLERAYPPAPHHVVSVFTLTRILALGMEVSMRRTTSSWSAPAAIASRRAAR